MVKKHSGKIFHFYEKIWFSCWLRDRCLKWLMANLFPIFTHIKIFNNFISDYLKKNQSCAWWRAKVLIFNFRAYNDLEMGV